MRECLTVKVLCPLLMIAGGAIAPASSGVERYSEARYVMGTLLTITLYHGDSREARRIFEEAFAIAAKLDAVLSNYKSDSEVSRLNARAGRPVAVSPSLRQFLMVSKELSRRTNGAFDVTVGPLVDLWQDAAACGRHPTASTIRRRRRLVGDHLLEVSEKQTAALAYPGMRVETGGLGKGFAVDRIAAFLEQAGVRRALINFGRSSVLALGPPPGKSVWRLVVQFADEAPLGVVEMRDTAFSASDSMGQSFEIAGRRYGHIIDPRTAKPLTQKRRALAMTRSATQAEVLSKYLLLRRCHAPCALTVWGRPTVAVLWEDSAEQYWIRSPQNASVGRENLFVLPK